MRKSQLQRISRLSQRPQPFAAPTRRFWTDRYISKHALKAHLNPYIDDASRKLETIDTSVSWITQIADPAKHPRLLDLGCGPGLYTRRFTDSGYMATGIDISNTAIKYARKQPITKFGKPKYVLGDYTLTEFPGFFDVVTLIYGGFCVHSEAARALIVAKTRHCLESGGFFIFDVFTRKYAEEQKTETDWYFQRSNGFWEKSAHLVLEHSFDYPESNLLLNQYLVVPPKGKVRSYHLWYHYYTAETIRTEIERHGFIVAGMYGDLTGAVLTDDTRWIGVVCRK